MENPNRIEQVDVHISEPGNVVISQANGGDDDTLIILNPLQVPLLISILQRVLAEQGV